MNVIKLYCLSFFLLSIIFGPKVSSSFAKNYYVAPNGSDKNSGLNISHSFKTINYAIKIALSADSIFILPGRYSGIVSINKKEGEPEKPICISGYLNDEKNFPIIDGGSKFPSDNALNDWIYIRNSSWIVIRKIKFRNGWTDPIKIESSSYITFDSCMFWGGKRVITAAGVFTHHILVENCCWDQGGEYLWKIVKDSKGIDAWLSMHHLSMSYFNGSLIDFYKTGGSIVIRNNTIKNAYNAIRFRGEKGYDSNIEIYDNKISNIRDNDFEPEYYTYNLHIYHNYSHNIHKTMSIDNVEGGNIYYYGNVITSDTDSWTKKICSGFWKIYGSERQLSYPVYAFNNSFCGVGNAFVHLMGKMRLLKHFNNSYFFFNKNGLVLNRWDTTDEFNYDISNRKWPANFIKYTQEKNGKIADIDYIDKNKFDLRLGKYSPGIDAGKVMSLKDFDWVQSFEGKAPDIGAFENGMLVEGPPFRFLLPPGSEIKYKEKPRIVQYKVEQNKFIIYFSDKINESSVNKDEIFLFRNNVRLPIDSVFFPENKYEMELILKLTPTDGDFSIYLYPLPRGINGESVTYWASVIKIHKRI